MPEVAGRPFRLPAEKASFYTRLQIAKIAFSFFALTFILQRINGQKRLILPPLTPLSHEIEIIIWTLASSLPPTNLSQQFGTYMDQMNFS